MSSHSSPLLAIVGPTASGKSALALALADAFDGEILSCDSVAIYRGLDVGSAKPLPEDRARVLHFGLDLLAPDEASTAGDYARMARTVLREITSRGKLPILVGGTGLYVRATLDGLAPAPQRDDALRDRLRARVARRGPASLHRLLRRLDPRAARQIHPNDIPKLVRSLEVTLLGSQPQTRQWESGREALSGYRVLQMGLDPPRTLLYERINERAAWMFGAGLLAETAVVMERYGVEAQALGALGYAQAVAVLQGTRTVEQAVQEAQQGHRQYAKRQLTWFRRDKRIHWLQGFGFDANVRKQAHALAEHLIVENEAGGGK